ncbi:hypothetical protein Pfra02_44610 [Pseudomonas fragi]|nr:hypothetical protein Pfra02_44610 [Pseudomonas fragi]
MSWYEILAAVIIVLFALAVRRIAQDRRETKRFYADLRAMNREKIDQPGWVKQPWQHEPGECKQQRLLEDAKIEAYAASKPEPE